MTDPTLGVETGAPRRPPSAASGRCRSIRLATYNVHGWVGTDGRLDVRRTLQVVRSLAADIVALQEVTIGDHGTPISMETLAAETTSHVLLGPTLQRGKAEYGNVLLTRFEPRAVRRHDITLRPHESRGVLDADVEVGTLRLRVVVTHLGIRASERRQQTERILEILAAESGEPVVLLGDINEWFQVRAVLRKFESWFGPAPAPRTYPSRLPLFALDRIWARPPELIRAVTVHKAGAARTASDHLPLSADLLLP